MNCDEKTRKSGREEVRGHNRSKTERPKTKSSQYWTDDTQPNKQNGIWKKRNNKLVSEGGWEGDMGGRMGGWGCVWNSQCDHSWNLRLLPPTSPAARNGMRGISGGVIGTISALPEWGRLETGGEPNNAGYLAQICRGEGSCVSGMLC